MQAKNNSISFYFNTTIRIIILASFFIIGGYSLFARGRYDYSDSFLNFMAAGAIIGIIVTVSLILLDLFKNKFIAVYFF